MKQAKIVFLRHGECEGGDIARGQIDVPLTAQGHEQMRQAFARVTHPISHIFSSPLVRCKTFAASLSQQLTVPLKLVPALQEINFGVWDGQAFDKIYHKSPSQFDAYWRDPWNVENTPDQGESVVDFAERVQQGLMMVVDTLQQVLNKVDDTDESIPQALVVTHGGVIRCIMGYVLNAGQCSGLFANLAIPYAAIMVLDVYWPDDVDIIDRSQPTAMESKPAKVSFRLHWPKA
ncbi:histidine phosphatase family protein [Shewanella sp. MEBiC00475]|uniref:histidine phosphatase family protein n=1 Tax=Shewanella sp. MEBiC00475 TaxID=2575361 RepID=UPI001586370A|nr:histidine phosphatase family protein [Shewanella sp. MEBiC00475]